VGLRQIGIFIAIFHLQILKLSIVYCIRQGQSWTGQTA